MKPISGIQPPVRPASPFGDPFAAARGGNSGQVQSESGVELFANLMSKQVQDVNSMQLNADDMVHSMLTGGEVNEAEALTAVQKADLAFRMLLQVRNKLVDAYREIQQIQI
jgi:flagellar hook-basal body complex protein FliE